MLTDAGGEPEATDPRLVELRRALAVAPGVQSIAPPRVNESGTATVMALTATTAPSDPRTSDLVTHLRTQVPGATRGQGVTACVGGITAAFDDLAVMISSRLPLVIAVVLALSFVVLLVAFRSVLVPLKAILCNLLAVGPRSASSRRSSSGAGASGSSASRTPRGRCRSRATCR